MSTTIEDRVFLVTGANSGIGEATVLGLARLGGTVVMACRSATRGEAARQDIVRQSGNSRVSLELVDLASEASTRAFAEAFQRKYSRLDVLINNAGLYTAHRNVTADGLEQTFEVNYLSGFLLTHLLLDLLKKSSPSRIVNVSSRAHEGSTIRSRTSKASAVTADTARTVNRNSRRSCSRANSGGASKGPASP